MPVLHCGRQVVAFLPQVFGKGEFSGYFSVFFAEFVSSSSCPDAKNMLSGGRGCRERLVRIELKPVG
jgi:hypothetical protein